MPASRVEWQYLRRTSALISGRKVRILFEREINPHHLLRFLIVLSACSAWYHFDWSVSGARLAGATWTSGWHRKTHLLYANFITFTTYFYFYAICGIFWKVCVGFLAQFKFFLSSETAHARGYECYEEISPFTIELPLFEHCSLCSYSLYCFNLAVGAFIAEKVRVYESIDSFKKKCRIISDHSISVSMAPFVDD